MWPRTRCLVALWTKTVMLLLLVASTWTARVGPKLAHPDYSIYHTKEGVFQAFQETVQQCSSFMKVTEWTAGDAEYSTTMSVVTVEPGGLTSDHSSKIRLLLDFGEHGRELISSEIALRLLGALCGGGSALAELAGRAGVEAGELQEVLNRTVLQVIPMENVRGRELVEGGALCERKNGRGVDPNRNWGVHWGFKEKDYDPAEEFPGEHAFSEPEVLLVKGLAEALRPHVWLNVHSGMAALFMPYDHQARIPDGASANATLAMLSLLNDRVCEGKCAVGSGGKSVGYLAHGTATDYMYDVLGVPISMTWEVYGDMQAAYHDCFRMFNPLSPEEFNKTVDTWAAGVLALLTLLPDHPDIPPAELVNTSARQAQQAAEEGSASPQQAAGGAGAQEDGEGGGAGPEGSSTEGEAGSGAAARKAEEGSSSGSGSKQHAKAKEIAAALLGSQHLDVAAGEGGGAMGAGGSSSDGAGGLGSGGQGAGGLELVGRPWWHHRHGTKADWEAVGLMFLALAGIMGGYLMYSKPQVRYALSRWGLVTRRSDIPL